MVIPLALSMRPAFFANWQVPPNVVEAHLPPSLSVDTYDGSAWLTAVALKNVDVRPRGFPSVVGFDVPELNLHTKVTCDGTPGIYYFSVDVPSLLGTVFSRLFYRAPYHYANVELRPADERVDVTCRRRHPGSRPVCFDARYTLSGSEIETESGSLAHFLTERHRFFTQALDGAIYSATVRHVTWPLRAVEAEVERNTLFRANGFGEPPDDAIHYYSPGVEAAMSRCLRWPPSHGSSFDRTHGG